MIPKFRAWDKFDKEMLDVHGINYDADGVWTKEVFDEEDNGDFIYFSDIELLQSTGLLDKNGKEIYEGDIVKIDDHPLQVSTSKISGVPIGVNINGNYVVEYSTEDMAYFIGNWKTREVIRHSEVIGNKFEHPHLLGEE